MRVHVYRLARGDEPLGAYVRVCCVDGWLVCGDRYKCEMTKSVCNYTLFVSACLIRCSSCANRATAAYVLAVAVRNQREWWSRSKRRDVGYMRMYM